ncbi:MAG: hypothetical protein Q9167_006976 [Letrouitia subvulpina]
MTSETNFTIATKDETNTATLKGTSAAAAQKKTLVRFELEQFTSEAKQLTLKQLEPMRSGSRKRKRDTDQDDQAQEPLSQQVKIEKEVHRNKDVGDWVSLGSADMVMSEEEFNDGRSLGSTDMEMSDKESNDGRLLSSADVEMSEEED